MNSMQPSWLKSQQSTWCSAMVNIKLKQDRSRFRLKGIGVSGNNSAAVTVSAPTDTSFTVNAYVRLGLKFADGDRPAGVQAGNATDL